MAKMIAEILQIEWLAKYYLIKWNVHFSGTAKYEQWYCVLQGKLLGLEGINIATYDNIGTRQLLHDMNRGKPAHCVSICSLPEGKFYWNKHMMSIAKKR